MEEKKKKKGGIDLTVIGCVLLIILLTALAVLPPVLRITLPDRIIPAPSEENNDSSLEDEGSANETVLVCTKPESNQDTVTEYKEQYNFRDDLVYQITYTETKTLQEESTMTLDSLLATCEESITLSQEVEGVQMFCGSSQENAIEKTTVVLYDLLDRDSLLAVENEFTLDFLEAPTKEQVTATKEANDYFCN